MAFDFGEQGFGDLCLSWICCTTLPVLAARRAARPSIEALRGGLVREIIFVAQETLVELESTLASRSGHDM